MRLLVTGAGGLIGGELVRRLGARHDVVCGVHEMPAPPGRPTCPFDLLEPATVAALVRATRPDAVVHAAAWADPDACERDPAAAHRANVDAVAELARAARQAGIPVVSFSTDLVLPGDTALSSEQTTPRPILVYGRTKRQGEEVLLAEHDQATAVRVALVTGRGHGRRGTATESIAWALAAGRPLRLYTDQFRTPLDVGSLVSAVELILARRAAGLLHLGGPERLSRHELGLRVARELRLDASLIEPSSQAGQPGAPRPADVSMDSSRARRVLGWEPVGLDASIREGRRHPVG